MGVIKAEEEMIENRMGRDTEEWRFRGGKGRGREGEKTKCSSTRQD